jgi:hypothetical protein
MTVNSTGNPPVGVIETQKAHQRFDAPIPLLRTASRARVGRSAKQQQNHHGRDWPATPEAAGASSGNKRALGTTDWNRGRSELAMESEDSAEQSQNMSDSIRRSLEGDSNFTVRSDLHERKHLDQRISTQFGIQIEQSEEQSANASDSSRQSFDGESKITV